MTVLIDTGVLLQYVRATYKGEQTAITNRLETNVGRLVVSAVSLGEIASIALRNKWGSRRITVLEIILDNFVKIGINTNEIIERYAEIDAYSQGRLVSKPTSFTARNMGKNDLWIAATASVYEMTLLTLDKDFGHLDDVYIALEVVE